jgi:hypothetical protein
MKKKRKNARRRHGVETVCNEWGNIARQHKNGPAVLRGRQERSRAGARALKLGGITDEGLQ